MDIGLVGLGKMGLNMALRLERGGHRVVATDRNAGTMAYARERGVETAEDPAGVAAALPAPRVVWLMLPAGPITNAVADEAAAALGRGDVVVDGANSNYRDTLALAARLRERGVELVDCGVSGGIWGLENGYSLMAGGTPEAFGLVEPAVRTLAPAEDRGWAHVGPTGAGHFTKMVHNGVEYGMMQAYAEGFALLNAKRTWGAGEEAALDLAQIAETWRFGSVVQSWLLDLGADALKARPQLDGVAPFVPDSGEGRWTVEEAIDLRVPTPVIAQALFERFSSRAEAELPGGAFGHRMLSALRGGFGGHDVKGEAGHPDLHDDGTVTVVPGGLDTEGARVVREAAGVDLDGLGGQ